MALAVLLLQEARVLQQMEAIAYSQLLHQPVAEKAEAIAPLIGTLVTVEVVAVPVKMVELLVLLVLVRPTKAMRAVLASVLMDTVKVAAAVQEALAVLAAQRRLVMVAQVSPHRFPGRPLRMRRVAAAVAR